MSRLTFFTYFSIFLLHLEPLQLRVAHYSKSSITSSFYHTRQTIKIIHIVGKWKTNYTINFSSYCRLINLCVLENNIFGILFLGFYIICKTTVWKLTIMPEMGGNCYQLLKLFTLFICLLCISVRKWKYVMYILKCFISFKTNIIQTTNKKKGSLCKYFTLSQQIYPFSRSSSTVPLHVYKMMFKT